MTLLRRRRRSTATATATLEATATTDLEPLLGHPEELVVPVEVHAEPFRILADLVLGRHVVGVDLLLEHDRIGGRLHGHGERALDGGQGACLCCGSGERVSGRAHELASGVRAGGSPGLFTAPGCRSARRGSAGPHKTRDHALPAPPWRPSCRWQTDARCGNRDKTLCEVWRPRRFEFRRLPLRPGDLGPAFRSASARHLRR